MNEIETIHRSLANHFNTYPLEAAGRMVYYDAKIGTMILAVHATSPEKAMEISQRAWDDLPEDIKGRLQQNGIGFAVKQI